MNLNVWFTYFAKVANRVTTFRVGQRHYVEKEGFNVVVQRFVIEEEFGKQTEMLAVLFVPFAIYLPDSELLFAVNL